jgi:plastocyanin
MAKHRFSGVARGLLAGAVALFFVAALAGGTASAAAPNQANTKTIKLGDNFFSPSKATVTVGTTVTFRWSGSNTHNVTVDKGPQKFKSPNQSAGTYTRTFLKPGTYKIVCTFHSGMNLTLKVKAPKPPPTTTTPPTT